MNKPERIRKHLTSQLRTRIHVLTCLIAFLFVLVSSPAMALSKGQPVVVKSSNSFEVTVKKLKDAIKGKGLNIVFEANHQNMMKIVGIESRKSITIGFAKPQVAAKFLTVEPLAALEMPMRITVRELNDGGIVVIYYRPSYLFAHYGNEKLTKMARKRMDPMVEAFVRAATE